MEPSFSFHVLVFLSYQVIFHNLVLTVSCEVVGITPVSQAKVCKLAKGLTVPIPDDRV